MTPEITKEMETLLDLFNHEGWKIFIDEQEVLSKGLKEAAYLDCETNDVWQFRRGALSLLDRILSYENTIKLVMSQEEDYEDV